MLFRSVSQSRYCAVDYSYTFLEKSVVEYSVNGGGRYTHPVWNYGSDHITVVQKFFGIPYRFATFLVERRQLDLDHQLILLVPVKKWCWWRAIFANLIIDGHRLVRLDVATKDYAVMKVQSPDGVFMSVSKLGELRNAHVTVQNYETVKSIAKLSKIDIAWPTVSSTLQTNKASATLLELLS